MTGEKLALASEFYLSKGFNVIPFNFKKAVMENGKIAKKAVFDIDYGIYHKEKVTKEIANGWWKNHNAIAVVTGKISGITVMDLDTKDLPEMKDLPKTFTAETNKGFHFYFKYTDKVVTNANLFKKGNVSFNIDIRNDGGIIYAAPSEYELPDKKVAAYKIINNVPLADFPLEWLGNIYKNYGFQPGEKDHDWKNKLIMPIENGRRNMDFTSIVGGLLNKFPQDEWESIVWPLVRDKNGTQPTPLAETELRTIFTSIAQKELKKRNSGGDIKDIYTEVSEENILVEITLQNCVVCFKAKNIIGNLMEAMVVTWIKKPKGLSHEIPFYLKITSDSNKEAWARLLSKTFDKKDEKEIYPWTILIAKVSAEVENQIRLKKQHFVPSEISAKPTTWLVEPFIQEDQINTFFGLGSSGKTLMSLYFSLILLEKGKNTLFIDYENDNANWKDKLIKMSKNGEVPDNLVYFDSEQIPLAGQVEKIREVIKKMNIHLVVVDSASLSTGESTSDEKAVIRLMSALKLLKTTVLLIAHQRKNDGEKTPIGSVQFENQARNVWNFKKETDEADYRILHLACSHTKANNTFLRKEPICFKIDYQEDRIDISEESPEVAFEERQSIFKRIINLLREEELTYKEIAERLGISDKTSNNALSRGKNNGKFINKDGKWSLPKAMEQHDI